MKQFENQVRYQGSAQSQGFSPVQAPDSTSLLRQNIETEQRGLQRVMQSGLAEVDLNKLANLSDFSQTLSGYLVNTIKKKNEADEAEGLNQAYQDGFEQTQIDAYRAQVKNLESTRDDFDTAAMKAAQAGEQPYVVNRLQQLSGWKKFGYAKGLAMNAGRNYLPWLANQLENNREIQVKIAGQEPFYPADAQDPAQKQAAISVLRKAYLQEQGLVGLNHMLLNEYAFPHMKSADQEVMNAYLTKYNKAQNEEARTSALSELVTGISTDPAMFGSTVKRLMATGMSGVEARSTTMDLMYKLHREGQLSADGIRAVKNSPSFMPGKTWGELASNEWFDSERKMLEATKAQYKADQETEAIEKDQFVRERMQAISGTTLSNDVIDQLIASYQQTFQTTEVPKEFSNYKENYSLQAKTRNEQEEQIQALISQRRLTTTMLTNGMFMPELEAKYAEAATRIDKLISPQVAKPRSEFKPIARRAIANLIGKSDKDKTLPDSAELAVLQAEADLESRAATLMQANPSLSPQQAYIQASMALQDDIQNQRGVYKTNGLLGDKAGFAAFMSGGAANQRLRDANTQLRSFEAQIRGGGLAVLSEAKQRQLISEQEAREMVNPSRPLSASVMTYTRLLQRMGKTNPATGLPINEFDVADLMLGSYGLKRKRPFAQQWADSSLPPELQRLLTMPTGSRTSRALVGAGMVGPGAARQAVKYIADQLGVDVQAVATFINYETGNRLLSGSDRNGLDTWGGSGGQYLGWIQFSPDNQQKYGVKPGMSFMQMADSVVRYLKDRGIRPGDPLHVMYQAVQAPAYTAQARATGRNYLSDSNGSVADHVQNMIKNHGAKTAKWLSEGAQYGSVWANPMLQSTLGRKVLGQFTQTSGFGQQEGFRSKPHEGNDYAGMSNGSKLSLKQSGQVIQVGSPDKGNGGYGGFVDIQLADGNVVRMGHLTDVYVKPGQRIGPKQVFALSGGAPNTRGAGRSTGPHVHLEHLSGPTGLQESTKGKRNPSAVANQIYVDT